jgi:hypothetical protein
MNEELPQLINELEKVSNEARANERCKSRVENRDRFTPDHKIWYFVLPLLPRPS